MPEFEFEENWRGRTLNAYHGTASHVDIPDGTVKIDSFGKNESMKSVFIPECVQKIWVSAFSYCEHLENIIVSEKNQNYSSYDGALYDKEQKTLLHCPVRKRSISFPETLEVIEKSAFSHCEWLRSVILPEGVTTLEKCAFFECTRLEELSIPTTAVSIDRSAFFGVPWYRNWKKGSDFVFINDILIDWGNTYGEHIVIPDGAAAIGMNAFRGCDRMRSISIPDSVKTIQKEAFSRCENLESVILPKHLKDIQGYAFEYCHGLKRISFPDELETVGNGIFYECRQMVEISYRGMSFLLDTSLEPSLANVLRMTNTQDFSLVSEAPVKYSAIWGMFERNAEEEKVVTYIRKHFAGMFRFLIERNQVRTVQKVLDSGQFIRKTNIDEYILYAIEKRSIDVQILLTSYKAGSVGYEDTDTIIQKKFSL